MFPTRPERFKHFACARVLFGVGIVYTYYIYAIFNTHNCIHESIYRARRAHQQYTIKSSRRKFGHLFCGWRVYGRTIRREKESDCE